MSLEQLDELLEELSDRMQAKQVQPLRREYEAKLMMHRLPGLDRHIALAMITSHDDPWKEGTMDPMAEHLAVVFARNEVQKTTLNEIRAACSPGGQRLLDRAVMRYKKTPVYQTTERNAEELMLRIDLAKREEGVGEATERAVEDFTDQIDAAESERLKAYLRENWGIESWDDWYLIVDARNCIAEKNPEMLKRSGYRAHRAFTKAALRLANRARGFGWTPSALLAYESIDWKTVNPGAIIDVPGGGQVYGDRTPVHRDNNGQPRRKSIDIFGRDIADNMHPDYEQIRQAAEKAFLKSSKRRN